MEIRYYEDHNWMVRRWDKFNGGKQVGPKSFCQFWRTVLLWASCSSCTWSKRPQLRRGQPVKRLHVRRQSCARSSGRRPRSSGGRSGLFAWCSTGDGE
ncbi:hypothetical protein LCGC14_1167750 [marine sediment metagenome]|uniref:Uncharacterized protein n=1 Tax=marine sediment metagenome TaxID=412755 RepID=A0A0F9MDN2_9ZZZZ